MPSLIQYVTFLHKYHKIVYKFLQLRLSVNNMKMRLNETQVLKLKMIPKTYSLLPTSFEIMWSVVGALVKDLPVGGWLVVGVAGSTSIRWIARRSVAGAWWPVDGRLFCK